MVVDGVKVISFEKLLEDNNKDIMIVISAFEREIQEQMLRNKVFNFITASQIDFGGGEEYYDEQYFEWQKNMGKFGAKIKSAMFSPHIKDDMTVIEFGAGGVFA